MRMRRLFSRSVIFHHMLMLVVLGALMVSAASPVSAASGDLDTSFDGDGKLTTDFGESDQASAVAGFQTRWG